PLFLGDVEDRFLAVDVADGEDSGIVAGLHRLVNPFGARPYRLALDGSYPGVRLDVECGVFETETVARGPATRKQEVFVGIAGILAILAVDTEPSAIVGGFDRLLVGVRQLFDPERLAVDPQ